MRSPRPLVRSTLLACSLLLLGVGCDQLQKEEPKPPSTSKHEDLVMGYTLLADTLDDESKLKALGFLKKITFRGPVEEVSQAMKILAESAKKRKKELKDLRKLEPVVTGEPATSSPIGDAITALAKDAGTAEMLDRDGAFDLRFMLLQAQATRMVSAMALAIQEHEPNAERRKWLGEVAKEYEGYRDQIVEAIRKYIRGEGAAQKEGRTPDR